MSRGKRRIYNSTSAYVARLVLVLGDGSPYVDRLGADLLFLQSSGSGGDGARGAFVHEESERPPSSTS